ncbi:E3 ubiquitin-protein ligase pub3 isoform X3 [Esox lucius]|nr:E3 ubiquitin-protein ligase pub3 isoform X3 [Esox lucius]
MRQLFRPGGNSQVSATGLAAHTTQEQTGGSRQSLRYQTQQHLGNWGSRQRKRAKIQHHNTFNKDVILLTKPSSSVVVKHLTKQRLHEHGHILNGFEFQKSWDLKTVTEQIRDAFGEKLSAEVSLEFLMACGNRLISPKLRAGQELDANLIHKVYKSKALYLRPSKPILVLEDDPFKDDSSDDNNSCSNRQLRSSSLMEARHSYASSDSLTSPTTASPSNSTSAVQSFASSFGCEVFSIHTPASSYHSNISPNTTISASGSSNQLPVCPSTSQPSTLPFGGTTSVDPTLVLTWPNSTSSPYQSSTSASHSSELPSTSTHHQATNYDNYLSIMSVLSDLSSDEEELNQAILASLHSERTTGCWMPAREILQDLATKITQQKRCKFNINRSTVLDGAIRGFKRRTYDPCHTISVRFSDDMGVPEEAVDLGGPRREFLTLLMEALPRSQMFKGEEGKMNLSLDSTAMREDRYFIAGRAIAVSLVHGGPPAGFLSPTLFSCLADGPELAKPVLADVADSDLRDKIKRVIECKTFEELLATTEPLEEYLANAGCLRPLRKLEDKNLLVDDILMFQVMHRVRGPFERFRDGLRTLGVLDKIKAHPESFRPLLCWSPTTLTADLVESLFTIRLSPAGSNKRHSEEVVVPFWRDYLTDAEEQEETQKLGTILAFATGANIVPPIGFSPQPSIEFLHPEHDAGTTSKLPIANTCINCLKLPLHTSYKDFKENLDFALGNTHGFGMA